MKTVWRIEGCGARDATEPLSEFEIKRRIFENVRRRMNESKNERQADDLCVELNPDVIVIQAGQTFLFEPQNKRVSGLLQQRYRLSSEAVQPRERIRVHSYEGQKMVEELRAQGFKVAT